MAPFGPPDPFLDRPGSPPVLWVQWIREFSLFLDQAVHSGIELDRSKTLLRYLGQEGSRVLFSVLDPNGTRTQTGTWTYEEMVSALTKHYATPTKKGKMYVAAAVGGAAVCGVGAVVAAPFVLAGIGFTSAGIAAGSIAASMMSSAAIANGGAVAAGSAVALLQSAGAVGLTAGASAAVGGVGAAVGGAVGSLVNWVRR